jgi:non-ribosomal peptide synthetase component F
MTKIAIHSRRAALSALASVPALAILPVAAMAAAPVDPVFAAIERHRAAWAAFDATCGRTDEVTAQEEGRAVTEADHDAYEAANAVEAAALEELLAAPTTIAGLRAAFEYLVSRYERSIVEDPAQFLVTLLKSPILAA